MTSGEVPNQPHRYEAHEPWAHVRIDSTSGTPVPHLLVEHLLSVSSLAAAHAKTDMAVWARLAGLWHDLGKYRVGFARYIRQANAIDAHIEGRVKDRDKTHSAAGALWAERVLVDRHGEQGRLMARALQSVIAGHHAGLDNWDGGLAARLASEDAARECDEALAADPPEHVLEPKQMPDSVRSLPVGDERSGIPGRFALWQRMLFSALVDADFLDTERFYEAGRGAARAGAPDVEALKRALDEHMGKLACNAPDTPVNRVRADVLRQCRAKALHPPGAYTLTVPTGGGKTLASLAFALDHAVKHDKRRVIYAIPYTSIIEQTADVFRQVFASIGDDVVVEHHSNAESEPEHETSRSRLACENWDAPIIVTTNVQLFESLFARHTSRCRKLHNIVGSVIVLDEAQLLPVEFLQPIVDVLRLLIREYGVTVVLCTATQPVLTASTSTDPKRGLRRGFDPSEVTEIIDDVPALYAALERVRVRLPASLDDQKAWPDIADDVSKHDAVLAIVSRRADAKELFGLVKQRTGGEGCWHLSALMCAQHRSDVIRQIKAALQARHQAATVGEALPTVRVISTQVVEAGVDLDFPVVYRALAGLDSIAQAAGRCNREGRMASPGEVHVFVPPTAPPPGLPRLARDACRFVWHDRPEKPFELSLFHRYFRRLYHDAESLDAKDICAALRLDLRQDALAVRFRDAAESFRLIDDAEAATVLVRYRSPNAADDVDVLLRLLERDGPSRWLMRKLQRYGVTVYKHQLDKLIAHGDVAEVASCPGLHVQAAGWDGFYDPVTGANVDGAPGDPSAFFVWPTTMHPR
jgi:CRISPR-associated endonuclease/helicase Cas3